MKLIVEDRARRLEGGCHGAAGRTRFGEGMTVFITSILVLPYT